MLSDSISYKASGHPRRVLIVDDNLDTADSLAMLFERSGHEVTVAYSVDKALEIAIAIEIESTARRAINLRRIASGPMLKITQKSSNFFRQICAQIVCSMTQKIRRICATVTVIFES
jgi:hypothetical protein